MNHDDYKDKGYMKTKLVLLIVICCFCEIFFMCQNKLVAELLILPNITFKSFCTLKLKEEGTDRKLCSKK